MDLTTVEGQLRDYLRKSGRGLAHTADLSARELVWVLAINPHMTSFGEALRHQLDRELKAADDAEGTPFAELPAGAIFVTEGEGEYVKLNDTQAALVSLSKPFTFPAPTVCDEQQIGYIELAADEEARLRHEHQACDTPGGNQLPGALVELADGRLGRVV